MYDPVSVCGAVACAAALASLAVDLHRRGIARDDEDARRRDIAARERSRTDMVG